MRSTKWMVGIILFASVFLEGADHIINVTVPGKKEFVMVLMAHAIAGRVER